MAFDDPFLLHPPCTASETGVSVPDDPHAVSVSLPTWESVISYKKRDVKFIKKLKNNFPGYGAQPTVKKLFDECKKRFAKKGQECMAFPSEDVAQRFQKFLKEKTDQKSSIHSMRKNNVFAVCFPKECLPEAELYSLLSQETVSSRLALNTLQKKPLSEEDTENGRKAKKKLQSRIADISGEPAQNIVLFPTGISALSTVHRFLQISFPERKSIHVGFATNSSLRMQEEFGNGVYFFEQGDKDDFEKIEELLAKEKVLGIFYEVPGNPLSQTVDLQRLEMISRKYNVPIIIDDTLGTFQNRNAFAFADVVVSGLSKFFSGAGNVTGGALMMHSKSRFLNVLARVFHHNFEDLLWYEDATVLEENSRDFTQRTKQIDASAKKVCSFLQKHPMVYRVYFPTLHAKSGKDVEQKRVLSFLLCHPRGNTPLFYDAVRMTKGPNFGMNWSMLTPYYQFSAFSTEDIEETQGISPYMLRLSVGLEDPDDVIQRLEEAFDKLGE